MESRIKTATLCGLNKVFGIQQTYEEPREHEGDGFTSSYWSDRNDPKKPRKILVELKIRESVGTTQLSIDKTD